MIYLFIHQNFPAQYLHVARRLARRRKHRVYFITQECHNQIPGIQKLVYSTGAPPISTCHPYTVTFDNAVRNGLAVAETCRSLRDSGIVPEVVVGHCGWGETLFVKEVFPDVPLLSYFEFFYHAEGADVGFDPEFAPQAPGDTSRLQIRNTVNRLSFAESDWGHTATAWQRSLFPVAMQARISSIHEGVDTDKTKPDPEAWLQLGRGDTLLTRADQVITYVARNLEPYRGFHTFMRALPEILRRCPKAHVLIVGGDGLSYSEPPPYGSTYREMLIAEVGAYLDSDRVHFLGQVPYDVYLNVLQVSSVHIYLTYPFVLSWSLLEAMAAGCLVIGSATPPVLEVLRDRENGLTVDFFGMEDICDRVEEVLDHPDKMQELRDAARATIVERFDTRAVALPRWDKLLKTLSERTLPPELMPSPGLAMQIGQR
jgi:glycosyltransferase involved in cell wall biosynthesis